MCIRCAGIHRNLGVHISRVKSVNLDTWTPEQVISLQQMGNSRARAVYEAQLPDSFRRPQTDTALESFIRAKYEHKKYLAREWVPPSPPKVDWAKEIDDELERQKRKKKMAHVNTGLGISGLLNSVSGTGDDKKVSGSAGTKTVPLPAPLPKPKSNSSPKNPRNINATIQNSDCNHHSNDLLGLSSPTKPNAPQHNIGEQLNVGGGPGGDLQNDTFSCFLSATPSGGASSRNETIAVSKPTLIKDEEDFFSQHKSNNASFEKDKTTKLTKDNIMALYGQSASNSSIVTPVMGNFLQQHQSHHHPQPQGAALFGTSGGMTAYSNITAAGGAPLPGQQQQFMTPPNSVSMYNTPVMTAPVAFTGPPLTGVHMGATNLGFAGQFPTQIGFSTQTPQGGLVASAPAIMNPGVLSGNNSIMYPGLATSMMVGGQPHSNTVTSYNPILMDGYASASALAVAGSGSVPTANTSNLQQQFSNLNIGNVWQ